MISDVLDKKKKTCLDHKKTDFFPEVGPRFWSKIENFFIFSFFLFGLLKVFGDVLERKLPFLHNKKTELRKSEIFHFSKGVSPLFWLKI